MIYFVRSNPYVMSYVKYLEHAQNVQSSMMQMKTALYAKKKIAILYLKNIISFILFNLNVDQVGKEEYNGFH